jgi:hypothetical protein
MPSLVIAPTDSQPLEIATAVAGMRSDPNSTLVRRLGISHPRQAIASRPDEGPTDLAEELQLVLRPRERALAVDEHPQLAIGFGECGLGAAGIGQQCAGKRLP